MRTPVFPSKTRPAFHFTASLGAACLFAASVCLPGCGDTKNKSVSGKVTLNGQPVAGIVSFIGSDNKSLDSPINPTNGHYSIPNPPAGQAKIAVKGMGASTPPTKGKVEIPETKTGAGVMPTGGGGVPPPAKYADPENGLTYTVTSANQQTFDIPLKE